jgi:hypothetical protein
MALATSCLADAAVRRDSTQPEDYVLGRLHLVEVAVKLEEYVLRQLFCRGSIAKEMVREAEHHGLVLPDQGGKICRLRNHRRVRNVPRQLPSLSNTLGSGDQNAKSVARELRNG